MGIFNDKWNKNNFSIYKSEEKTVLKLIEKLNNFIGELTKGIDEKTDKKGNHEGSWQGLTRPTLSEEGMRATVEQINDVKIPSINENINTLNDNQEILFNDIDKTKTDLSVIKETQINVLNPPNGLLPLVPDYYDANWNVNPNPTDNSDRLQAIIDYVLNNEDGHITPIFIPSGSYYFTKTLVINKRYNKWASSSPIFTLIGSGNGAMAIGGGGTTLIKETSGSFIRMCEEENGQYPGGGAAYVIKPLNFVRRMKIEGINFIGNMSSPHMGNGITGRGIFRSELRNLTFQGFKEMIRFGQKDGLSETSADGISLDYCERNVFDSINGRNVNNFIIVQGGDITSIKNCYLSELTSSTSVGLKFIGGNDFVTLENNIFHFNVTGTGGAIAYGIYGNFLKGLRLVSNHIENLNGKLIGGVIDNVVCTENMILATAQLDKPINIAFNFKYGNLVFKNNSVFMPQPTTRFFDLTTEYSTLNTDIANNIVRTSKESTETYQLITNLGGAYYEKGQWGSPIKIGNSYLWTHQNKLYINSVKPTSGFDGTLIGG